MVFKLMGWLQLDGGTQKKIALYKKIGQDCITSFCLYCCVFVPCFSLGGGSMCSAE